MSQMDEKRARMFEETVRVKREMMELKDKYDALKAYWKEIAAKEFEDGIGEIVAFEDKGVRFVKRKGSIQKRKLIEQGVSEDIIAAATGESVTFELFG